MNEELKGTLIRSAEALKVDLDNRAIERYSIFMEELQSWNQRMNLTAITEPGEIITKHFVDSLTARPYLEGPKIDLIDIGCGAGFPGIPLLISDNRIFLTCLDSLMKRLNFIEQLMPKLEITQYQCIHGRAEELGRMKEHREQYDIAVSRAVAQLSKLLEYCLPLVKKGGKFLAMKGPDYREEMSDIQKAVKLLGGEIESADEITLPLTDMKRSIIAIRKIKQTPQRYPRQQAKINKMPL